MAESTLPLRVERLGVTLAGRAVLEDVSFCVRAGELVWLTGPNGAGKSTLMRAVCGLLPSRGDAWISGAPAGSRAARAAFAFVPDEPALYEDLTLHEHATFVGLAYARADVTSRVLGWLERFGLRDFVDEFPATHSRGMRQKLSLSLALGLDVPLLLLDEPFNGLDANAQAMLIEGLGAVLAAGTAVMLSAHQHDVGRELLHGAARARVLHVQSGTVTEIEAAGHASARDLVGALVPPSVRS